MATNDEKNEMLVMVLTDLAGICKKLTKNSAVPEELRVQATKYAEDFDLLLPHKGKGTPLAHAQGEELLAKMARFLPRLLEVYAEPRVAHR